MTFWIQHGYGKGDKIARLVETGLVSGGVLLSPGDEEPGSLAATARTSVDANVRQLIDPQLYVHSIAGAFARGHESHEIDFGEVSWFLSPTDISHHVEAILRMNRAFNMTEYIAPAPYLATFNDVWTPISLQYSRAFVEASDRPTFISVIAEDFAFADWDSTSRWLDALTTIDAHGIYLIVGHTGRNYPFAWEPDRLANVLRVIYALSELNEYEVVWAYSDIAGLAGLSVGAEGFATGWYHSLRMWKQDKWIPQPGGHAANPRVFLPSLLSPLVAMGEAQSVARTPLGPEVFGDTQLLSRFRQDDPSWGLTDAWNQHMFALATVATEFDSNASIATRTGEFDRVVTEALSLLDRLERAGVASLTTHRSRLTALQRGVSKFAADERI